MNDDRELHKSSRFLVLDGGYAHPARVLAFAAVRPKRERLFAGWVGADGNVVQMKRPVQLLPKRREEDWI